MLCTGRDGFRVMICCSLIRYEDLVQWLLILLELYVGRPIHQLGTVDTRRYGCILKKAILASRSEIRYSSSLCSAGAIAGVCWRLACRVMLLVRGFLCCGYICVMST